jgi:glycosyltransferase involved in cell wall biosynthesis
MISILIVVPTLNSYHLLPRLVQTIEDQSFTNWRVLFIDGGSNQDHMNWLRDQCERDSRFHWEPEVDPGRGIFAAMNQGFVQARQDDWVLFWGSDDMAADKDIFSRINATLMRLKEYPDLYICNARYYSMEKLLGTDSLEVNRVSRFILCGTLRRSLFWGSTPPHQATFFGPGARRLLERYDDRFLLTGDLDYYLRLSLLGEVRVLIDQSVLVLMGDSGVSATKSRQKYKEVMRSYQRAFGWRWVIPFISRYIRRVASVIGRQ